jgi:hypothetical protein
MSKINFKLILLLLLITSTFFVIYSCKEESTSGPGTTPTNTVQGYVKSANGTIAIQGAKITLTATSDNLLSPDSTYSDANGFYKFENVANGNKRLIFTKGSFSDTINITVPIYGNVSEARLEPSKPLAFYWGNYDNIQRIIRQMGYNLDSLVLTDFNNLTTLQHYSIIFINCGVSSRYDLNTATISGNLTTFLNGGGRIYASDWAFGCIKGIHPELNGTYDGDAVDSLLANVVYDTLATYLGKNTVRINYNLGSWLSLDPNNNYTVNIPFLRATYQGLTNNPIAFFRRDYTSNGKLIYTTFHEEAQVTQDMTKILQFFVFEL